MNKLKVFLKYRKDIKFKEFISNYFRSYINVIGIIICLASALWFIKDIFIIKNDNLLTDFICRFFCILTLPFLFTRKIKNYNKWIVVFITAILSASSQMYMNCTIFANSNLTGEGWITYYLLFFLISIFSTSQIPIIISYIVLSASIILFGRFCNYAVDVVRIETTGIILSIGFSFISFVIKNCFIDLYKRENKLKEMSKKDSLSGLHNRAKINDLTDNNGNLKWNGIVFLFDIDNFKKINDSNEGHMAGDKAIIFAKDCLVNCFRSNDIIIRYCGDEFLVVTESICDEKAIFGRINKYLSRQENIHNITFSCGSSKCENDNLEKHINRADKCSYISKRRGRNQLTIFEELN